MFLTFLVMLLTTIGVVSTINFVYHVLWLPYKIQSHFLKQGVCGPGYRPVFGNTAEIRRLAAEAVSKPMTLDHKILPRAFARYHLWSALHGTTFLYWLGTKPVLVIADPTMIKEVLMNTGGSFEKGCSDPLEWGCHRRICSLALNMDHVKVPKMVEITSKMLGKLEEKKGSTGRDEVEIDVHKQLHQLSADIISATMFGSSFKEGKRILSYKKSLLTMPPLPSTFFLSSASSFCHYRFLPTATNRERWRIDKDINRSIRKVIESNNRREENTRNLLTDELEIEGIVNECKTFYFAGKETNANVLTWAIVLLSIHQDWQVKAREEVTRVLGDEESPTADTLSELKLIQMILNETLRLYAPVTFFVRKTCKDVQLGGLNIPSGTQLALAIMAINHDVQIWGEDVDEFIPERFSEPRKHLSAFFPWGLGPRTCVGQNLAMVEVKIALSMIFRRYSFTLSPTYVHAPIMILTVQPQNGAPLILQRA
ncbi:hypothetical protein K2173_027898 [Erythroxylum novogranatense]|uniref:Cytochrome P450 n=1 Tax=Erythroxylum novogranatense TaxID=1862640 RepID=A0AAV8U0C7_9ROSI|nr:hypothetical protein K2173_027898 [Erythroxylum novogranatense]